MSKNEILAAALIEKYPDLQSMEPPYTLKLNGKLIKVSYYSTSWKCICELKAEKLCTRSNVFVTDFSDDTYAIFLKDNLEELYRLRCVTHEIGHVLNGHFIRDGLSREYADTLQEKEEEAEANEFADCYIRILRENELQESQVRNKRQTRIRLAKRAAAALLALALDIISETAAE